jgi:hypothetical protein
MKLGGFDMTKFEFYVLSFSDRTQLDRAIEAIPNGIGYYDVGYADCLISFEEQDTMFHVMNMFDNDGIEFEVVDY